MFLNDNSGKMVTVSHNSYLKDNDDIFLGIYDPTKTDETMRYVVLSAADAEIFLRRLNGLLGNPLEDPLDPDL